MSELHKKMRYLSYNNYLIKKYGSKTYKLPINIPVTCPNRDGLIGENGCSFCSDLGTGFESLDNMTPIVEQLDNSSKHMIKRYKAKNFIGYFQNYTNTYLEIETLLQYFEQVYDYGVVGIDIATRPDMLSNEYIDAIHKFSKDKSCDITFEIGLQIANDDILLAINRGHNVAQFKDCVKRIKSKGFNVCVHLILNLPDSTMDDVKQTIDLLNNLQVDIVKLHSLYIAKDCTYGHMYEKGELEISSVEEYIKRVIYFITHINKKTVLSRLVSRIPKENALFSNWDMSWWKIYNEILEILENDDLKQGIYHSEGPYEPE